MSEPVTTAAPAQAPSAQPLPRGSAADDLAFLARVVGALVVVGAVFGFVWAWWSPAGPRALVLAPGLLEPDETESFAAGDGRFLVLALVVGLLAALGTWLRAGRRGPLVPIALVVGTLLASLATELVGHLTGGGTFDGRTNTIIDRLPLSLHMQGLVFAAPAVAALLYGLLVAFAADDDLGRPDPVRDAVRVRRGSDRPQPPTVLAAPQPGSVGAGDHPQYGWGHGDAARPLQQGDLPPQ